MPLYCKGLETQPCRRHIRVSHVGFLCHHCHLKQSSSKWGGHRKCCVQGCDRACAPGRSHEKAKYRSLRDVVTSGPFCRACLRRVTMDLHRTHASTARRKMKAFMSRHPGHFLILIRRFGRSHIVEKRATAILNGARCPFLNTLCLQDRPEHREIYLRHYCRDPGSWIFVPQGASACTDFLSHSAARVLSGPQLLHIVDDNLRALVLNSAGPDGVDLPVSRMHLFGLLQTGQDAVQRERASAWGVSSFQHRSYMRAPLERARAYESDWNRHHGKFLRYTTFPRLLYGGFFAIKPTLNARYRVPPCFGVQDDVARTILHTLYAGKIVLFPRFVAFKRHNEDGGCVHSTGGVTARERQNDWIRRRLMAFASRRARTQLQRERLELIRKWWRRSRFLRIYLTDSLPVPKKHHHHCSQKTALWGSRSRRPVGPRPGFSEVL